ncbi:hypothetical protein PHPALM_11821 [Phytophthora palmivora]|uniref:Uncharacterized protein n=1 Tax=Phytophthora palmivora TaxID=4796 RepID=A0A2P4Y195_9STRA|nr:hypothetical protein PHPALM_11821 [Phytophthora palmivora]
MAPPSTSHKHSSVAWKPPGLHKISAKMRVVDASAVVSTEDEHVTIVEVTLPTVESLPGSTSPTASENNSVVDLTSSALPEVEGATFTTNATDLTLNSRASAAPTTVQPATRQLLPSKRTSNRASKSASQKKAKGVAVAEAEKNGQRPEADADLSYSMKEDCLVMAEVLGDHGVFNRENESKAVCWVRVTKRLTDVVLCKDITPDGLRKHIENLEKAYRKAANADRALSGREPKKTADQEELEELMRRYVEHKENEDPETAERKESKRKKTETDRIGGAAIRDAALSVERPHKMKATRKKSDPFAFLKELSESYENRRKEEARERSDRDVKLQLQFAEFQAQQSENLLQVTRIITAALKKPVLPGSNTEND